MINRLIAGRTGQYALTTLDSRANEGDDGGRLACSRRAMNDGHILRGKGKGNTRRRKGP